jgi:hypothetical protein
MLNVAIVGPGRWGRTLVEAVQRKSDVMRFTNVNGLGAFGIFISGFAANRRERNDIKEL